MEGEAASQLCPLVISVVPAVVYPAFEEGELDRELELMRWELGVSPTITQDDGFMFGNAVYTLMLDVRAPPPFPAAPIPLLSSAFPPSDGDRAQLLRERGSGGAGAGGEAGVPGFRERAGGRARA